MALSYQNYTGNNSTDTFSIPFTYTATSEISVTVDGVAETGLTFPSSSQVQLTSAPASGTVVQVRRTTNLASRAIDFASGSVLTEEDLDNSNIQIFHASQESVDLTDDTIQEDVDNKWDAESKVIKNVANPTNAQDAATKDYLENTWLTTADKAQLNSLNTTNLNTVAGSIANVNAVAGDATDIGTVSSNIASVNTVATNIADVVTVANDLNEAISEIETAALDLQEATSEIDTVSNAIANVNTVGLAIANVNTVAGAVANVNTTATNINNVNIVAGVSGNVTTVAGIASNVTAVAGDATDIGTVATNIADVNTVAANNADIDTVAGISANVTTVAGIASNVTSVAGNATNINSAVSNATNINTVAGIAANVTSVAGNATNINSAVSNETNINAAVSNATNINSAVSNATNINTVAGGIANVNTVATNLASVNNFADVYRIDSSAPTTSLDVGDLYFDTTSDTLKVYGTSGWQNAGSSVNGTSQRYHYDIGGAVTSVTGSDANGNTLAYDAGYVDVYVNGVRMSTADVTVTSGDTVTFAEALASGDEVDIVAYGTFSVASLNADNLDSGTVPTARVAGAYTGITSVGTLTGFTSTGIDDNATSTAITIDSAENVGIGVTPSTLLHIKGANPEYRIEDNNETGSGNIVFRDSARETAKISVASGASASMQFQTLGTERMRIPTSDSRSVLAIGDSTVYTGIISTTATSSSLISMNSGQGSEIVLSHHDALSTSGLGAVSFNRGTALLASIDGLCDGATGSGAIRFHTRPNGGSITERMKIDSSGNVGIGTATLSNKLEVDGGASPVRIRVSTTGTDAREAGIILSNSGKSADNDGIVISHGGGFTSFDGLGGTEYMRIVGGTGNVLVGTTSNPGGSARLGIKGSGATGGTVSLYIINSSSAGNFLVYDDGKINTGTTSAGSPYNSTTGTGANAVLAANGFLQRSTSSLRYKNTVLDATNGLAELLTLRPVTFKGNNDGDNVFGGLIAEEVHDAGLTEFVQYNDEDQPDALHYGNMVSLCIKAIQEQQATIETLTARITALEGA